MVRADIHAGDPAQLRDPRNVPALCRRPVHHQPLQDFTGKEKKLLHTNRYQHHWLDISLFLSSPQNSRLVSKVSMLSHFSSSYLLLTFISLSI